VVQVNDSFQKHEIGFRKPTIILLWPEVLPPESFHSQLQIQKKAFANTAFDLDTDIYTIFTSHQETPTRFKFSVWEFYMLKNTPIHQRLIDRPNDFDSTSNLPFSSLDLESSSSQNSIETSMMEFLIDDSLGEDNEHEVDVNSFYDELTNKVNRRSDFRQLPIVGSAKVWVIICPEILQIQEFIKSQLLDTGRRSANELGNAQERRKQHFVSWWSDCFSLLGSHETTELLVRDIYDRSQ